jgi:hypothetical protein
VNSHEIAIFLGNVIEDGNENHVLKRLCRDLAARGVAARVFANFHTLRRMQRQIDLLVVTDERLTLIELKCLVQAGRLVGGVNGRWAQVFDDGALRELDVNPYDQAASAAYAVSDEMRYLADRGEVPPAPTRKFFKQIDTVVCIYPTIPPGSQLDRADHVTVVGYEQLLARLVEPGGPTPPEWANTDWDTFARHLGVFRPDGGDEDPQQVHDRQILEDYRRSFIRSHESDLHELVTPSAMVDGDRAEVLNLAAHLRHTHLVVLLGRSGSGKTHTARHAVLQRAREGHLVVWARCGESSASRLSTMLSRAAAPHSTENPLALIDTADAHGRDAVLVLDGLNECSPVKRMALLDDLASLRRRHRLAVIISSTDPVPLVGDSPTTDIKLLNPGTQQRAALLASYGAAGRPESYAAAFTTPFELSMAAACARDLAANATRAELFRAFTRTQCPSVRARAVLREVARLLDEHLRASLPIDEVLDHLERDPEARFDATAIDTAIGSPLLVVDRGRVWFNHELLGRFLAAAELVHRPVTGAELAVLLADPRHQDLVEFAVDLDTVPAHRYDLLTHLDRPDLLRGGLHGAYGDEIQHRLQADTRAAFAEAAAVTARAHLEVDGPDSVVGRWHLPVTLPQSATQLLVAATECFDGGLFVNDITTLLEVTDQAGASIIEDLRAAGCTAPISMFVASAYSGTRSMSSGLLPAQLVMDVLGYHKIRRYSREDGRALAADLWNARPGRGWGLLFAAVHVIDPMQAEDRAIILELLDAAWRAGGYHLRLATLNAIHGMPHPLAEHDPALYEAVRRFLDDLPSPQSLGLSSTLFECLAAFDLIEPTRSIADVTDEIEELLAAPPAHDMDERAYTVWSNQFEAEALVGPVCDAVTSLAPAVRVRLLTMAVRGRPAYGWFGASLIRALSDEADPDDGEAIDALTGPATTLDLSSPFVQEAIGFHVAAVVVLARFTEQLPPADTGALPRVWRLVDELLHDGARRQLSLPPSGDDDRTASRWAELYNDHAGSAVNVLYSLVHAHSVESSTHHNPYVILAASAPIEVRQLLEWGLRHPEQIPDAALSMGDPHGRLRFVIRELGQLGDDDTAALLEPWAADPDVGKSAVEEIRRLRSTPPHGDVEA